MVIKHFNVKILIDAPHVIHLVPLAMGRRNRSVSHAEQDVTHTMASA